MSNALVVGTLADALIEAINTAWAGVVPGTLTIDEDSNPRTIQNLPFVRLNWTPVNVSFGGLNATVGNTNQAYEWEIILQFLMPPATGTSAGKLSRIKADYASLLIAQLQTGPGFAGIANMPLARRVDPREETPTFEGCSMLRLIFTCQVQAAHNGA